MPIKRKPGGGRKPKVKLLPAQVLPIGQLLTDLTKRGWSLGAKVGMGGCGEIFLAAPSGKPITPDQASHVIKIEPHANGPLFSELAFYHRAAKAEMIKNWQLRYKEATYVGVPAYIAEGWHELNGDRWRFMVMERFGEDLEMIFTKHGRIFSLPTVCTVAISLLNSLEYLHNNEYVHADIKGANLLVGRTKSKRHEVYLVDYGLAYRYLADGKHREYQEDPRCAHDGTIEFTSRDAHKGVQVSEQSAHSKVYTLGGNSSSNRHAVVELL
ncbi:Serine/threonine-protein kinase VRK1 [Oopsacas minuta]|uniref:non-specific serine/threonine protein kinase n=1 Tax=Oopsacas minuta TaxID=111878 RepID=A0AAV7K904_9METZ|nr:Serine/threonine-protein kinase VRK1 [Oopsacas minuta]